MARDGSGSLLVLNGHFGHAPWHHAATARVVAAQLDALADAKHPGLGAHPTTPSVVLVGDFNAVRSSQLLRSLTSTSGPGFVDAARAAASRSGPPVTFHWGVGATRMGLTLDYVLARGPLRAKHAEVIDVHQGRLYPSDHHPVVVEFDAPAP
jgi:endonuclease/exonuclease/phosphatase (EEP) superfamily protein YafD